MKEQPPQKWHIMETIRKIKIDFPSGEETQRRRKKVQRVVSGASAGRFKRIIPPTACSCSICNQFFARNAMATDWRRRIGMVRMQFKKASYKKNPPLILLMPPLLLIQQLLLFVVCQSVHEETGRKGEGWEPGNWKTDPVD